MKAEKTSGVWKFEVDGVTLSGVEAAAEHFGLNLFTLRGRIAKGWSIRQCLGLDPKPKRTTSEKAKQERWKHKAEQHSREELSQRRYCQSCKTEKPFSDYAKHPSTKHGIATTCRVCVQDNTMRNRYGIGIAEYDTMLASQGDGCAICRSKEPKTKGERFCVDHCHRTGKVRGLLCIHCNLAIGKMNDDQDRIRSAIDYLAKFKKK